MSWKTFEENDSTLANLCNQKLNRHIAYLATIKKDGSPRLHPITPFIGNGMLFMFTEPSSPKIMDLRRDGRFAIHCSVGSDGPLVEVQVCGKAKEVFEPYIRGQAEGIANSPVVIDSYVLFEFHIKSVLVVEYDKYRKPMVRRWGGKNQAIARQK